MEADMVRPTVHIKVGGYENIYFDCPHCGKENIINRVSDLSPMATTSGMNMTCQVEDCLGELWLNSDTVQSAKYRWFLQELPVLKQRKLYRDYALTLCQGAEAFFLEAVINKKFDRGANYRDDEGHLKLAEYNTDRKQYEASIRRHTFDSMRSIFLETFQSERENPTERISRLKEDRREWAFEMVKQSNINVLRNKVAHKNAYRPKLSEIDSHDELRTALYWLGEYLNVLDSVLVVNRLLHEM